MEKGFLFKAHACQSARRWDKGYIAGSHPDMNLDDFASMLWTQFQISMLEYPPEERFDINFGLDFHGVWDSRPANQRKTPMKYADRPKGLHFVVADGTDDSVDFFVKAALKAPAFRQSSNLHLRYIPYNTKGLSAEKRRKYAAYQLEVNNTLMSVEVDCFGRDWKNTLRGVVDPSSELPISLRDLLLDIKSFHPNSAGRRTLFYDITPSTSGTTHYVVFPKACEKEAMEYLNGLPLWVEDWLEIPEGNESLTNSWYSPAMRARASSMRWNSEGNHVVTAEEAEEDEAFERMCSGLLWSQPNSLPYEEADRPRAGSDRNNILPPAADSQSLATAQTTGRTQQMVRHLEQLHVCQNSHQQDTGPGHSDQVHDGNQPEKGDEDSHSWDCNHRVGNTNQASTTAHDDTEELEIIFPIAEDTVIADSDYDSADGTEEPKETEQTYPRIPDEYLIEDTNIVASLTTKQLSNQERLRQGLHVSEMTFLGEPAIAHRMPRLFEQTTDEDLFDFVWDSDDPRSEQSSDKETVSSDGQEQSSGQETESPDGHTPSSDSSLSQSSSSDSTPTSGLRCSEPPGTAGTPSSEGDSVDTATLETGIMLNVDPKYQQTPPCEPSTDEGTVKAAPSGFEEEPRANHRKAQGAQEDSTLDAKGGVGGSA